MHCRNWIHTNVTDACCWIYVSPWELGEWHSVDRFNIMSTAWKILVLFADCAFFKPRVIVQVIFSSTIRAVGNWSVAPFYKDFAGCKFQIECTVSKYWTLGYETVVCIHIPAFLPIGSQKLSFQWVYELLDHTAQYQFRQFHLLHMCIPWIWVMKKVC